jgi:uncharacterized protein YraI
LFNVAHCRCAAIPIQARYAMKRIPSPLWFVITACLLAVLAAYLPAAAAAPSQTPSFPTQGTVNTNANVRAGPGTTFAKVGSMQKGAAVDVTGCNADCTWYQLGTERWIAASLVDLADAGSAPAAPAAPAQASAKNTANLRSGPGQQYEIVGSAAKGQALNLAGRNTASSWYALADGSWISASLVDNAPRNLPVKPAPTQSAAAGIGVTRAELESVYEVFGFDFEVGTLNDGRPRALGGQGYSIVDLIGPPQELQEASVISVVPNDDPDAVQAIILNMLLLTGTVLPDWNAGACHAPDRAEHRLDPADHQGSLTQFRVGIAAPQFHSCVPRGRVCVSFVYHRNWSIPMSILRTFLTVSAVILGALLLCAPVYAQPSPPFTGTATSNANLRSGPGTTFNRVGGVQSGQAVQVAACNDGCTWYQLDSGSWIFAELVAVQAAAAPAAAPAAAEQSAPAAPAGAKAADTANLRSGPGTGYARVGGVTAGQALNVTGRTEAADWYQLADGNWIAAFLVTGAPGDLPVANAPAAPAPEVRTVSAPPPAPVAQPQNNCDPSYPTLCIPVGSGDLDCGEISARRFPVVGSDPHGFDGDNDGVGCERG